MVEEDKKDSFSTETGSLKFGAGALQVIDGKDCWFVPGLGIYDRLGAYLGETLEEAKQTLDKREANEQAK